MKYLLFNAVVLAALGYLYLNDHPLPVAEAPVAQAANTPTAIAVKMDPIPEPAPESVPEPKPEPTPVFTPPPAPNDVQDDVSVEAKGEETIAVATLPVHTVPPQEEAVIVEIAEPEQGPPETTHSEIDVAGVDVAEGEALMSPQDRTRELDRMIESMELFYVERIAR